MLNNDKINFPVTKQPYRESEQGCSYSFLIGGLILNGEFALMNVCSQTQHWAFFFSYLPETIILWNNNLDFFTKQVSS